MAQGTLFEPEELRAPVTIIDPATCAGMSFDALWVCALDSARWPAPASPDPFLPRDWQARQRIPAPRPKSRRKMRSDFWADCAAARAK